MTTVLIHPFAGVLSAYGMGLADVTSLREKTIEAPLNAAVLDKLQAELDSLAGETTAELLQQDIAKDRIETHLFVHLRYDGSDTALPVAFDSLDRMQAAYDAAYQSRFGFLMPGKGLVAAIVSVESIGHTFQLTHSQLLAAAGAPDADDVISAYMDDAYVETPVYQRDKILAGQRVAGPALIIEATGTNVIEPGWEAEMTAIGNLVVRRVVALQRHQAIGTDCDPVMLEVFNNLFMSIAEQMGC